MLRFCYIFSKSDKLIIKYCAEQQLMPNQLLYIPMFYLLSGDMNIGNFILRSVKDENTLWISSRKQWSTRGQ